MSARTTGSPVRPKRAGGFDAIDVSPCFVAAQVAVSLSGGSDHGIIPPAPDSTPGGTVAIGLSCACQGTQKLI